MDARDLSGKPLLRHVLEKSVKEPPVNFVQPALARPDQAMRRAQMHKDMERWLRRGRQRDFARER
jgi:hypothetical protein